MTQPAFLVDGHMEQIIVRRLCGVSPVRRINLNGRDVSIEAIAKQIATQFRLLGNRYFPVVVLIDRETREISAGDLKGELLRHVGAHGVPVDQLIVGVADRMIENWILADPSCHECIPADGNFEGQNGKGALRALLVEHKTIYHESTVGVEMFCSIRPAVAAARSPSFKDFIGALSECCDWAAQLSLQLSATEVEDRVIS